MEAILNPIGGASVEESAPPLDAIPVGTGIEETIAKTHGENTDTYLQVTNAAGYLLSPLNQIPSNMHGHVRFLSITMNAKAMISALNGATRRIAFAYNYAGHGPWSSAWQTLNSDLDWHDFLHVRATHEYEMIPWTVNLVNDTVFGCIIETANAGDDARWCRFYVTASFDVLLEMLTETLCPSVIKGQRYFVNLPLGSDPRLGYPYIYYKTPAGVESYLTAWAYSGTRLLVMIPETLNTQTGKWRFKPILRSAAAGAVGSVVLWEGEETFINIKELF